MLVHGKKEPTSPSTKKEKDEEASEIASGNVAAVIGIGIAARFSVGAAEGGRAGGRVHGAVAVADALFPHLSNLLFLLICHDIPPVVIINVICMKIIIDYRFFMCNNFITKYV